MSVYGVVPMDDATAVKEEVARQLAAFRRLVGRDPTHLACRPHIHGREPVRSVLIEMAGDLAVALRHHAPRIRYCGNFHGQTGEGQPLPEAISVDRPSEILAALPPGVTELACHPGLDEDELNSTHRSERAEEVRALCDRRVRAVMISGGIELSSFGSETLSGRDSVS